MKNGITRADSTGAASPSPGGLSPVFSDGAPVPAGVWREEFVVRTSESDSRERARASTIGRFLQEAAIRHARQLGAAFADLAPHGITWVLAQLRLIAAHWPRMDESVEVLTWPSGCDSWFAYREFVLRDGEAAEILHGTSAWALLDIARHRPVRVPEFIRAIPAPSLPAPVPNGFPRLRTPQKPGRRVSVRVLRGDLDLNRHVTNTRYLDWLVEAVPDDIWESRTLRELHVQYRAETGAGEELASEADWAAPGTAEIAVRHALRRAGDDRLLVLGRSVWGGGEPGGASP